MNNWINGVIEEVLVESFPNDKKYVENKIKKIQKLNIYESLNWIENNFDINLRTEFCKKTDFTLEDLYLFHKIYVKF